MNILYFLKECWDSISGFYKTYLSSFTTFVFGLFSGFIMFFLLYLFSVFRSFNKKFSAKQSLNDKFTDEDMKELISKTQQKFKEYNKKKLDNYIPSLFENCKNLILETSSNLYPDSQHPYLELTMDECLSLIQYLHDRIDELFDKKIISFFKSVTLNKIMIYKKKLVDKQYIKKYKKTNKFLGTISNVVNLINPFHWTKKIFFKFFYNKIFNKIGEALILILGEEVYKIYSKKIFESDLDINDIFNELQNDLQKHKNDDID
ncbi:hypothetical protein ['Camptotheca acuminata' phytoplasma]|uniref:hypothetical protein n=1 Tax='Camptotheca acuminata' phytoplasma TaxID=3239192 RepID=UPI00351A039A